MYGAMQMPEEKVGRRSRESTYETTVVAKSAPVAIRYSEGCGTYVKGGNGGIETVLEYTTLRKSQSNP